MGEGEREKQRPLTAFPGQMDTAFLTKTFSFLFVALWATPNATQGLPLALFPGIIPGQFGDHMVQNGLNPG